VNTDDLEQAKLDAERRVLEIQTKLHRWSADHVARRAPRPIGRSHSDMH
jgi:RNA-directed DNA polymerase